MLRSICSSSSYTARTARHTALSLALLFAACGDGDNSSDGTPLAGEGDASSADAGDAATHRDAGGSGDAGGDATVGADGSTGVPDTTPPTVTANDPLDQAVGQGVSAPISATFSEAMASATLSVTSFKLMQGTATVAGTVSYFDEIATFTPSSPLALNTEYVASISTEVTDLAGNALTMTHSWRFTTDATPARGPAPVALGASGKYTILAKSAVSNVPTSVVTGDIGLSPAAASYVTGFALTKAGTRWTSPQVVGSVFAADNDPPTPSNLTTAVSDMQTAYTDAAGRPTPDFLNLGAGTIGGMTLAPGLYKWASSVTIPTDITLEGAANDVWIFQITGDLKMSAAKAMILSGGARAKNIVWQVAGLVDLGTTAHAEGVVLSKTAIKLGTGASINGRLMAQTAVNIASSTVTAPAH